MEPLIQKVKTNIAYLEEMVKALTLVHDDVKKRYDADPTLKNLFERIDTQLRETDANLGVQHQILKEHEDRKKMLDDWHFAGPFTEKNPPRHYERVYTLKFGPYGQEAVTHTYDKYETKDQHDLRCGLYFPDTPKGIKKAEALAQRFPLVLYYPDNALSPENPPKDGQEVYRLYENLGQWVFHRSFYIETSLKDQEDLANGFIYNDDIRGLLGVALAVENFNN